MKQVTVQSGQGIGTLQVQDVPVPTPGPGEALVRLHAATLNFRDIIMAKGLIPGIAKAPSLVPLSCAAGVVEALGQPAGALPDDGPARVVPGDRVSPIFNLEWLSGDQTSYAMLGGNIDGVGCQYIVVPVESLVHNPPELGDLEAATLTCAGLTAWSALTAFRPTQAGEWVLAHGTGGVAIAALQFAHAIGAKVAITSSSDAKLARARSLGADVTINYRTTPDWAAAVREAIGGANVANVVDTIGAVQFDDNASLLQPDGQMSAIGMLGSDFSWTKANPQVNLAPIAVGSREQHEAMLRFIVAQRIKPVVDVVFDLDRIGDAYRTLESGAFFGKVGINLL